jgi:hypothetical protein
MKSSSNDSRLIGSADLMPIAPRRCAHMR